MPSLISLRHATSSRDVAVLRIVRSTTQIPDDRVRIHRVRNAASGPDVLDDGPIGLLRPGTCEQAVGDDAALQRLVLVMVRRDEARHDDRAGAVDDLGVARGHRWRDLDDLLPVDQDVGLFEVADSRVETEDDAAAQQDAALSPVADEALEICWRRGTQASELTFARGVRWSSAATCRRRNGGGDPHRAGAQELAPALLHVADGAAHRMCQHLQETLVVFMNQGGGGEMAASLIRNLR